MTLTSKALCFKSKFITAELARLFSQSDSEEEFEGFSEDEEDRQSYNKQQNPKMVESEDDSDVDTGFYSDGEDAPPPKRRSLLVALRFPMKRLSTPKQEPRKKNVKADKVSPPSQRARRRVRQEEEEEEEEKKKKEKEEEEKEKKEEEEEEGMSQSLKNHYRNIEENKAMLAKLFADLRTMADLTVNTTPSKKKRTQEKVTPRKRKAEEMGSERRNPSRKARPRENFAVEEKSEPVIRKGPRTVDIRRLVEVDEDHVGERRKMRKSGSRRSQYVVKSVDEITEEDLDNIAYRSKDKIWDKENGSSCHQCRQKTLDTKTVCRSGFCVGAKGQFCGPCLKNRYGEDVRTVLLDPTWSCPICRGMCNCSLCRKKEGRCATGILVGLARYNGHDNVHEYLESIQKELH
ncbi:cell division cycle-associated 7-like protein [Sphaeramia orbicularis]|uniref:Zinc-finger domain-containing protein n=1 Tax=Sphaeramia orbicularis TaxID=375764 RepID=A0A672YBM8_9TELE|nr:cell division cycle-associated 7-like protein [Sphaeramia orbicularis]XP_030003810.1 cell division cycle-associated 7-like protein [Sphaeramia orbicularis]